MHRSLPWFVPCFAWLLSVPAPAGTPLAPGAVAEGPRPPNVVIVYADDLGYGDIGCYGARGVRTPNIDRIAAEGVRFTDFYVAQAVCTASRAALLTGCYPNRIGLMGALGPKSKIGIHDRELTLAEMFKTRGYATAIFGKWHLGDDPKFLPTRHGFDEYFGLPYSNDMWPRHPENPKAYPDLPLIENDRVVQIDPDQRMLTTWYTQRAVKFIEKSRDRPFFLYVPHNMPHVPLFVSDKHKGSSQRGLYGDVIQEIDWSVGQILDALKKHSLDEHTLVIFASDNGPWLLYGDHAGSAGPLREGKATSFDGGVRVPCVMRWPGKIPPGTVCREVAATIDVLPTLAKLAGADLPRLLEGRVIDGKDVWPLMSGQEGAKSAHDAYFIYWGRHLQAVRAGKWKLHFPHSYPKPDPPGGEAKPGKYAQEQIGLALFDMEADPGETTDVAGKHPEVVERLKGLAEKAREDLGDSETKQEGKGVRQPGRIQVAAPAGQKPNVLFIAVDDLNDWVGCLGGHPQVKTPNIDRLAQRGTLFTRAYCAAPACNPSRAALLTGVRPHTSGVYHNTQPWRPAMPDAVTLPQYFMKHGYHAAGAGKIFHGGFDEPASWNDYAALGAGGGANLRPQQPGNAGGITWGALDVSDERMPDHRIVSWAIEHLAQKQDKPLFLACGLHKPHMPWHVPRKYFDMYPLEQIKLPEVPDDDLKDVPAAGVKIAAPQGDHSNILKANAWREAVQGYLASISFADTEIGRLLDALDAGPNKDNTIVVLWGDHGWHLGEKHHWRKFALWEEATRTPLIICAPGVTRGGTVCDRPVELMSLYSTLAELCGLPAPEKNDAVSLRLLLEDPKAKWEHIALTTHGRGNHAVRTERWRYIRYADGSEELYDHDADPHEWKNLAGDEKYAEVKKELAGKLPKSDAPDAKARAGGPARRRAPAEE